MKQKYYVNKRRQDGRGYNHEVHKEGCRWIPDFYDALYLGEFSSSEEALEAAKKIYFDADGCMYCCSEINHD